jgi:long-chain fatty acid transport protein
LHNSLTFFLLLQGIAYLWNIKIINPTMKKTITSVLLIAGVSAGFAQGFQVNALGTKQLGMAHSGAALQTDATSLVFNPGTSAFQEKNEIALSGSAVMLNTQYLRPGAGQTIEKNNAGIGTPFNFSAMFGPKKAIWKAGITVYTPFGGNSDYGKEWSGRFALTSLSLRAIYVQPTVSLKITDQIGIGAGFVYNFGSVDLQREISSFTNGQSSGSVQLKGNGQGYGYNVGVYYKPTEVLAFSLTHRSTVSTTISEGDVTFKNAAPDTVPFLFNRTPNGKFSSTLRLPSTSTFGIGLTPNDQIRFAFDFNFVNWTVYDTLGFDFADSILADSKSPRMYENSVALRIGAEYKPIESLALRAGVGFASSAVKREYITPETPDGNRLFFSLGLGYQSKSGFGADAAFQFIDVEKRVVETNIPTGLIGTYKTTVMLPSISLSYKF